MPAINADETTLLAIDFQSRLMPAIAEGEGVLAAASRVIRAAALLDIPVLYTEQNPAGLGETVAPLQALAPRRVVTKTTFDASRAPDFWDSLGPRRAHVAIGCESHVCVLQTVLGLRAAGHHVYLVADAVGSRDPENKARALSRLAAAGVEIVTSEMVIFEWLGSAEHPRFRDVLPIIKET